MGEAPLSCPSNPRFGLARNRTLGGADHDCRATPEACVPAPAPARCGNKSAMHQSQPHASVTRQDRDGSSYLVTGVDLDGDGIPDALQEQCCCENHECTTQGMPMAVKRELKAVFRHVDKDHDGECTWSEFNDRLGDKAIATQLLSRFDVNCDTQITQAEFLKLYEELHMHGFAYIL